MWFSKQRYSKVRVLNSCSADLLFFPPNGDTIIKTPIFASISVTADWNTFSASLKKSHKKPQCLFSSILPNGQQRKQSIIAWNAALFASLSFFLRCIKVANDTWVRDCQHVHYTTSIILPLEFVFQPFQIELKRWHADCQFRDELLLFPENQMNQVKLYEWFPHPPCIKCAVPSLPFSASECLWF